MTCHHDWEQHWTSEESWMECTSCGKTNPVGLFQTTNPDFQEAFDHQIAEHLRLRGKTPDCICEPSIMVIAEKPHAELRYTIYCPVHYPETSALLKGLDDE